MIRTWLSISCRNLVKNRRRSAFTILAVSLGYASINLFGGYFNYIFTGMREGYVHAYAHGHLNIFKQGFLDTVVHTPEEHLFSAGELEKIGRISLGDERVVLVSPLLEISGLVSNGEVSAIFTGLGRVPEDVAAMRRQASSFVGQLEMFDGEPLCQETPSAIGISGGLAAKLGLPPGSDLVVLATTVDGHINAMDAQVVQVFDAPFEILDDKLLEVPLRFARSLYDTEGADRLVLLLRDASMTSAVKNDLSARLREAGLAVDIRQWDKMCPSYLRIRGMFGVMFGFLFVIVLVIVVLSVVNTIGMSVIERTREIGTLRALGLKRRGVLVMFATESALLGLAGSLAGILLTLTVVALLRLTGLTWIPPVVTRRVPLEIHLGPTYMVVSLVALVLLSVLAAILPARRASRKGIIEALGHV